ncbi:MAG: TonB family protein [Acidobacteria bacterium]|nr:TonB family protein [Acidobacteriota bacterium]
MVAYADAFEHQDRVTGFLAASLAFHAAITGGLLLWDWYYNRPRDRFGDPNALGAGVTVTAVSQIPLPSRGRTNPVANETESQAPQRPKPKVTKAAPEDESAIPILKSRKPGKKQKTLIAQQRYQPRKEYDANQVYSSTGARVSTPMFGTTSAGGVGVGVTNPFGTRFGWYADLIRQRVAEKWRTQDLDARLETAPIVIVTFDIQRTGQVGNIRLLQRSGNYAIDLSAQRAIQEASPLPPLPDGFERNAASVEFRFQFKR